MRQIVNHYTSYHWGFSQPIQWKGHQPLNTQCSLIQTWKYNCGPVKSAKHYYIDILIVPKLPCIIWISQTEHSFNVFVTFLWIVLHIYKEASTKKTFAFVGPSFSSHLEVRANPCCGPLSQGPKCAVEEMINCVIARLKKHTAKKKKAKPDVITLQFYTHTLCSSDRLFTMLGFLKALLLVQSWLQSYMFPSLAARYAKLNTS